MGRRLPVVRDALVVGTAFTACLAAGVLLNTVRARPLKFPYQPPAARLHEAGAGFPSLTHGEARRILRGGRAVFIDAREPDFFEEGHIAGARNLPVAQALEGSFGGLPRDPATPLVIYCSGGDCEDSLIVAGVLAKAGFGDISIFSGGWDEWSAGEGGE